MYESRTSLSLASNYTSLWLSLNTADANNDKAHHYEY